MGRQCEICYTEMVEKPLFTSTYWECPRCTHTEENSKTSDESEKQGYDEWSCIRHEPGEFEHESCVMLRQAYQLTEAELKKTGTNLAEASNLPDGFIQNILFPNFNSTTEQLAPHERPEEPRL